MGIQVIFRPITAHDWDFLSRLYASTREEELQAAPWSQARKKEFLQQQFTAQHKHYQEHFPHAQFELICHQEKPIGRLYVARSPDELRLLDIALLPEYRGQGLGTYLVKNLFHEATATQRPLRLHVESFNPAYRLYERLGFRHVEDHGVYQWLEWRPMSPLR